MAIHQEFYKVFDNFTGGVVIHAANTQVLYANSVALNLLGLSFEQMLGKEATDPCWRFIREDGSNMPRDEFPVQQVLISGKTLKDIVVGVVRNDIEHGVWVVCNAHPEFDEEGKLSQIVVNFTDITYKKHTEFELRTALAAAEAATKIKSRFLAIAAHELRTPVTSFSLLLQLTLKKLEVGIPVEIATVKRLIKQGDRISQLVLELLDVSRLERGTLTLKPQLTDLGQLVADCLNDFKPRAQARSLQIIKPDRPIMINIDPLRISQVLSNLIDNAIKYSREDAPIEVSLYITSTGARVEVKDQGPGISEEEQAELFGLFKRGSTDSAEKSAGLGLGLYISRDIIGLHGGTVGVTSKVDVGSTFYFELPWEKK